MADKYNLYVNAYYNTLVDFKAAYDKNPNQDFKPFYKKLIIYGVKAAISKPESDYIDEDEAEEDFLTMEILQGLIAQLTLKEFMELYPIDKEYNGHKWGMKDYYYTKDYIKGLDVDKPIGKDNVLELLWEYSNWKITEFTVEILESVSRLRELNGEPSLAEEFAEEMGLKMHTLYKDQSGNEFIVDDETGKTTKLVKPRPSYLKVVK